MPADDLLSLGAYRLDAAGRRLVSPRTVVPLSALEARLLEHLARHRGEVLTPEALLVAVWGYRPGVRSKAVALTISRLRHKLHPEDGPVIETAPGGGYRAPDPRGAEPSLDHLDRLRARIGRNGAAFAELDALMPAVQRALERERPPDEQARLWLARAVWACQRQIHLPAVPLWALAEALAPSPLGLQCALWAGRLVGVGGSAPAVISALEPWLARCPADPIGRSIQADLLVTIGNYALRAGRLDEARAAADQALELADRLGDSTLRGAALGVLGRVDFFTGEQERGRARTADAIALLTAAGEVATAARIEQCLGVQLYTLGDLDAAEAALDRAARTLDAVQSPLDAAFTRMNLGTVLLARGQPQVALDMAEAVLPLFLAAVDHTGETMARLLEGRALALVGRVEEAQRSLERVVVLSRRLGIQRYEAHAQRYLCWVYRRRGDVVAARAAAEEAARLAAHTTEALRHLELWRDPEGGTSLHQPLEPPAPGPGWIDAELSRRLIAEPPRPP